MNREAPVRILIDDEIVSGTTTFTSEVFQVPYAGIHTCTINWEGDLEGTLYIQGALRRESPEERWFNIPEQTISIVGVDGGVARNISQVGWNYVRIQIVPNDDNTGSSTFFSEICAKRL